MGLCLQVVNEATYVFRENDYVSGEEDNGVEDENEDVFEDDGTLFSNNLLARLCEESVGGEPIIINGLVDIGKLI